MNESKKRASFGYISSVSGSLIEIKGLEDQIRLHDQVQIVEHNIIGEVIQIHSDHVIAQCFESTNGIKLSDKVLNLNESLSMELAPGLLSNIFDGIQRPLDLIFNSSEGNGFLEIGITMPSISRTKKWHFTPEMKVNDSVEAGDIIGTVQETPLIKHRVMVPPGIHGILTHLSSEGEYSIEEKIYRLKQGNEEKSFNMIQKWPIYRNRPYKKRNPPNR